MITREICPRCHNPTLIWTTYKGKTDAWCAWENKIIEKQRKCGGIK